MKMIYRCSVIALASVISATAFAAVSANEAKQLGTNLTPWGAEKAGNKDGTIPAYTGEGVKPPPNYDPKDPGQRPEPFNDKPLFSITSKNYEQYLDKLDGHAEMFKRFPDYRMDIYPTHRTMKYPKYVLDNSVKNATSCKTGKDELSVEGCYGGYPFPIPKTGAEVMWNHLLGYLGHASVVNNSSWVVTNTGNKILQSTQVSTETFPFYDPAKTTPSTGKDPFWKIRVDFTGTARRVGEKLILIDSMDPLAYPRRAWSYLPGQRRVKLSPDLAYDTPSPAASGVGTMDDSKGFGGALDRYEWKLIGKKEKYIMYNNFKMSDHKVCSDEVTLGKNFLNPDCVRFELHRVWVVEATLKPGFRHIYHKRVFYWDEDGYQSGLAENYDASGKLYRLVFPLTIPYYESFGTYAASAVFYDLQTGQVALQGGVGAKGAGGYPIEPKPDGYFAAESLAGEGIR